MEMKNNIRSVCLIVLNWNGIKYLKHLIPSLLAAQKNYKKQYKSDCTLIILDNHSTESDIEWIKYYHPEINVILSKKNDYLFSYNDFLKLRYEDICILLNNDLKVDSNFIQPLVSHFSDSSVFAVTAKSYDWDGTRVTSGPFLFKQHRGWFYCMLDTNRQYPCYTLFATGGYMAVDRKKFLALGGFDRLYYPAYGEDLDICYRAWCKGWKSIYEPNSVVYHYQSGSWDSQDIQKSSQLMLRSNFLFQWRNLRHIHFYVYNRFYLFWLLFRKTFQKDTYWLKIYKDASLIWKKNRSEALIKDHYFISIKFLKNICGSKINTSKINIE